MAGVRLKRLKIDKYRNVAPGTELVFNDGFNVLLGKNGTGKTTLLRLIAMVVTGSFGHLKDDEFGLEYELAVPGLRIIAAIRNEPQGERVPILPEAGSVPSDATSLESEPAWSCEFAIVLTEGSSTENLCTISTNPQRAVLHYDGKEHPIAVQSPFERSATHNPLHQALLRLCSIVPNPVEAPDDATRTVRSSLIGRLLSTTWLLEAMMANGGRFDEALGGLEIITAPRPRIRNDAGDIRPAFLGVREDDPRKSRLGNFIPSELYEAVSTINPNEFAAENLRFEHGSLKFLQKAANALGVNGITLIIPLLRKDISRGHNLFLYAGFEFLLTLADGRIISHSYLSYGQKRLLSFLYYTACNPAVVIADELVNGLHYEWIGACLKEIQDRQSFLTSQNPILLDMLPFESADDIQRSFILCSNEVRDGRSQMVWKTMSEQSADVFFRAYETQALQVSEILRTNNLW